MSPSWLYADTLPPVSSLSCFVNTKTWDMDPCSLSPLPKVPARKSSWQTRMVAPGIGKIRLRTSKASRLSQ